MNANSDQVLKSESASAPQHQAPSTFRTLCKFSSLAIQRRVRSPKASQEKQKSRGLARRKRLPKFNSADSFEGEPGQSEWDIQQIAQIFYSTDDGCTHDAFGKFIYLPHCCCTSRNAGEQENRCPVRVTFTLKPNKLDSNYVNPWSPSSFSLRTRITNDDEVNICDWCFETWNAKLLRTCHT